jgi:hypothetical protein
MIDSNWDSDQMDSQFKDCETVRDVITFLEAQAAARGEVICEIRLNGHLLQEEDETRYANDPRSAIRALSIRCDRPEHLIGQALKSAISFIPLLTHATTETAKLFREGEINKASEQFNEALQGCQWFVETVHHARGAASGMGTAVSSAERWHEAEKLLFKVVRELTETFDRKDYVLTADVLEYELTAALEMWQPVLQNESSRRPV